MVYRNGNWGTVCDDGFSTISATAACFTLGLGGGSYSYRSKYTDMERGDSVDSDPMKIWKNIGSCTSGTSNFLDCPQEIASPSECDGHWEDVVLFCS